MRKLMPIIAGMFAGLFFTQNNWSPFINLEPDSQSEYSFITDKNKQQFFQAMTESFQAKNPKAEPFDIANNTQARTEDVLSHEQNFFQTTKQIHPNCPTKQITVATRWADIEAKDRKLTVFQTEMCNSSH